MNLRDRVIRLAHSKPELRGHLLPLLMQREARDERGAGGLIFNFERGFSLRTQPTDPPYNQTYDGLILVERTKKPYQMALQVVREFRSEIERLKTPYAVSKFVDEKVLERVGKTPSWHSYSMPD